VGGEANPQRGAVKVTVGGREAVLVATLSRLAVMEDMMAIGISDLARVLDRPRTTHIVMALEALSAGTLDREFLGTCLMVDIDGCFVAVRKCIVLSFTGADEAEDAHEDEQQESEDPENPPPA